MIFITLLEVLIEATKITLMVFLMMIAVDLLNVFLKDRLRSLLGSNQLRQYTVSSSLGVIPGCLGSFAAVSLYAHGLISFGAIIGNMIATSGDEAFVMLSLFPRKALLLFAILFLLGVLGAWISDRILPLFKIKPCPDCVLQEYHPEEGSFGHYLEKHIFNHILKEHIWKVFLWSLGALLIIHLGTESWDLPGFVRSHLFWVLILGALAGIIPESGPNLVFVMMFSEGIIPFSILLTNSIVQDGHAALPLLSYSVRDTIIVKGVNLILGLLIGGILFLLGI